MMEFFDCHLCIGKFFYWNPFVFFAWESLPMNEVMDDISNMLRVNDVFHFGFFDTGDNLRGRWW